MSKIEKIRSLIGFANKAGKLTLGRTATVSAFHRDKLELVLLATDASPKLKRFARELQEVPIIRLAPKADMGQIVGRDEVAVIGVLDRHFAEGMQNA